MIPNSMVKKLFRTLLGDYFGVGEKKSGDHFGDCTVVALEVNIFLFGPVYRSTYFPNTGGRGTPL